jgi:hypothetical protein
LHDGESLSRGSTTYWLDARIFSQRAVNWNRADWSRPPISTAAELLANRVRSMGLRSCGRHCCPLHRPPPIGGSCRLNCRRCKSLGPADRLWFETKGASHLGAPRLARVQ